ncbi:MAG: hypothetical protein IPP90_04310 [Gemmatimonadaceae bacterium]|nr:hypothetical protein [Gemmatimonadaceae bacterium]
MRTRFARTLTAVGLAMVYAGAPSLAAQRRAPERLPSDGGLTTSLGQPGAWQPSFGVGVGRRSEVGAVGAIAEARVGVYREFLSRSLGLGGAQIEAYGGSIDTRSNGGVRGRLFSPFLRVGFGADYDIGDRELRPIFSLQLPLRRGGLFHDGSAFRFDLTPGRVHSATLGIETPIFRRIPLGVTRPLVDRVRLAERRPAPIAALDASPALREALAIARAAATRIQRLCVPWLDHKGVGGARSDAAVLARLEDLKRTVAAGDDSARTLEGETRRFHDAMDRAFSLAIGGPSSADVTTVAGRATGDMAREILLAEVLLPYDRLLGQVKEKDTTHEFAVLARGAFLRWLHVESPVPGESVDAVLAVFYVLLDVVEENRQAARTDWGTSRFVWLPLQFALRPEQHDTQAELDALVARATESSFTEGNVVSYLINEQFQYHVSRTIREAEDYHVLWTHDFRGVDAKGDPDEMSFRHVLRSYLAAMTARVRAYDRTGTFPTYIIILDEWFYEQNHSSRWMNLLEDPTRYRVRLPSRFSSWEDSLRAAQDTLLDAIAASSLLGAQRRQYGETWLRNLIKVHVNITNASDPSFASWQLATRFPVPDTWMRDHRKVVFYDITEDDPYRGEAIFTGAGIGEHYANLSWEDRSLLLRGPAALSLKTAARELLRGQGIAADRIPLVLQPRPLASDYDVQIQRAVLRETRPLRALQIHNGTGYDAKQINVAKAVLYTLMPPGSVIKIPDSLWNGTFWGSALVGCALRGVRVVIIAPAYANAPARAFGSMIRSRELLWRLLKASQVLAPDIARAGGLLKVGLYASELPITDIPGKVRSVKTTLEQHQWLRDLYDFPEAVYPGLDQLAATFGSLTAANGVAKDFESRERALLHLKANFLASREAWRVMAREEWVAVTGDFVKQRLAQVQSRASSIGSFTSYPNTVISLGDSVVQRWYDEMTPATRERVVFFTILGSPNQNDRSFVADGEDALVLSNWPSIIPYLDLLSLVGQSKWIETPAELDALLPRQNFLKTRVAHWFKFVF